MEQPGLTPNGPVRIVNSRPHDRAALFALGPLDGEILFVTEDPVKGLPWIYEHEGHLYRRLPDANVLTYLHYGIWRSWSPRD